MNKLIKKVSLLTLLAALAFAFVGCGGGGTPEEVAEKYCKAVFALDAGTMTKLSSSKFKDKVEQTLNLTKKLFSAEELKVLQGGTFKASPAKISEDGNSATVKVELTANGNTTSQDISLVKEDGAWKIKSHS